MLSNKGRHDTTKLGSSVVQELKINQRRILIDSLEIGIPAPEQMIALGERQLPNGVKVGQLLNSKTLNYKKLTPHRDGLFCERIFGPVQSFVCACGKKKESVQSKSKHKDIVKANLLPPATRGGVLETAPNKNVLSAPQEGTSLREHISKQSLSTNKVVQTEGLQPPTGARARTRNTFGLHARKHATVKTEVSFCPKCQVEYISKNVRRHRLGYIKLFAPVTHIWYLKGRPSYLSLFFGKRKKAITSLAYCNAYLVEQVFSDLKTLNSLKDTDKSADILPIKGNVKVWQNLNSNDVNKEIENNQFFFNLNLSVSSKQSQNSPLFLKKVRTTTNKSASSFFNLENDYRQMYGQYPRERDTSNDGNHKNYLYKTQNNFQNRLYLKNVYSESFNTLLIQLFQQIVTQKLQTKIKDVPEHLLERNSSELKTVYKQNGNRVREKNHSFQPPVRKQSQTSYPFVATSMVSLWETNSFVKQDVTNFKLAPKKLKYKASTKLEAIKYFVETAIGITNRNFQNSMHAQRSCAESSCKDEVMQSSALRPLSTPSVCFPKFPLVPLSSPSGKRGKGKQRNGAQTHRLSVKRDQSKVLRTPYVRAQTLPFLPSLICSFHLRDCLLSFLQSLPCTEDLPIPIYCETPRRYPLRDVHKFLAELRSTNASNKGEVLTSESITKFIGRANQKETQKRVVTQARHIKRLRINKVSAYSSSFASLVSTSFLQPFNKYPLGSYISSVTPNTFLKKEHRNIVVHKDKVRDVHLFSQNKVGTFLSVASEYTNRGSPIFTRKKKVNTTKQSSVIKSKKWGKEKSIRISTRLKKHLFTPNGIGIGNVIKNTRYNQQVMQALQLLRNTKVSAREIKNYKIVPKVALVPLNLNLVTSSTYISNSFVTSLHSNKKHILGGVLHTKHFTNKLLYPERSSSGLSTPTQLLARETRMSLRGVLLNTFLEIIKARFVDLSLPLFVERFQINGVKKIGLRHQQKQSIISPNSETIITSNQTNTKPSFGNITPSFDLKVPELIFDPFPYKNEVVRAVRAVRACKPKRDNKQGQTILKRNIVTQKQVSPRLDSGNLGQGFLTNSKVYLQNIRKENQLYFGFVSNQIKNQSDKRQNNTSTNLSLDSRLSNGNVCLKRRENISQVHLLKERREIKYKPRKLRYMYVSTLLYARQFKFDERRFGSNEILFERPSLRYKYRYGVTLNISSPTSASYSEQGIVYNTSSFQNQYKNGLNSDLQTFFFRSKIDTYQARLLHLVFKTLPKDIFFNQLTLTKSSSLHKNQVLLHKQNKALFEVPKLGCTYLLTKSQEEQKQENLFKNSVHTKTKFWYACSQNHSKDTIQEQGVFGTSQVSPARVQKPLRTKVPFLYKLGCLPLLKDRERLNEHKIAKLNLTGVKAFSELTPATFGKGQPSLGLPDPVVPKLSLNSTKNSLYKVHLNPVQVLKTEPTLTKLASSANLRFATERSSNRVQKEIKQSQVTSTSFGSETISKWHINGAKEILLYTGGGALESLLKRFNTSLFCQFLLSELEILRKHYKDQIVVEYNKNKIVAEHHFNSSTRSESNSQNIRSVLPKHSGLPLSSSSITTEHVLDHKEQHLGFQYVVADKSANLFCRRIYRTTRRLKIVQLLMRSKRRPEWMMISILPVLPPDLRPVLQMGDNLIVASDLNTLYQRVIYRNNRHYKGRFLDFHFVSSIHRLVQDAVDRLIENGKGGSTPFLTPGGRPLKSLSDILKGKRGRFRFNLLGKRVDFSGRSVIVVDPNLKIHECGLPKEMALELYKYLLIRQLLLQKRVSSIVHAKKVIKERKLFIWDILRQIIYYHPLLLNRAPTLHRLGIQAFQPKLTLGNAILLHPLVCAGFNADFDGDQMGVHLPLSPQARAEAWDLLWSRNNLLSPATGQPILLPSQDMVLGFYYMTSLLPYGTTKKTHAIRTKQLPVSASLSYNTGGKSFDNSVVLNQGSKDQVDKVVVHVFSNPFQVIYAYQKQQIDIHTPIWLKWSGKSENGEKSQTPLELRVNAFGDRTQIYPSYQFKNRIERGVDAFFLSFHIRTTVGRVLVNNLIRENYQ